VIAFPPSTAQKWILPNGLTVIVQEDHSAPVASVQAWCATGSIDEDQHLGAGLSHILEHMLFKGTKTQSANQIAQSIQNVGGYINAYTSFDRTVFWIDVPKDGVGTALEGVERRMMNSTLRRRNTKKSRKSSGASSPWAWMTPIAWLACSFLGRRISGIPTGFRSSASWRFTTSLRKSR
jgi:Predicted Zn-dependent peptidases